MKAPKLPEGFVVAIDGPAASGKGSTAAMVAEHFGLLHIDSGAIYRAVALLALEREITLEQYEELVKLIEHVTPELLKDPKIRSEEVSVHASRVSKIQPVRVVVDNHQYTLKNTHTPGAVVEGRDIGIKVFPNAHVKFFITATPEARAMRRHKDAMRSGKNKSFEEILEAIKERDHRDIHINKSLLAASDAIHIDNTELSKEEVFNFIIDHIHTKYPRD